MRHLAAALFFLLALVQPALAASNNILLIIADDFGIDNAEFYRNATPRFNTTPAAATLPNLKALADRGIIFTRHWATPWCSPTRSSVITGRYPFRHGLGVPIDQGAGNVLSLSEVTLPELIGGSATSRNYITRHVGKFHLRDEIDSPRDIGWQTAVGPHPGSGAPASGTGITDPDYFGWRKYTNGTRAASDTTVYATTDQVDEAIATINSADAANRSYFLWVGLSAPHSPFHAAPGSLHSQNTSSGTNRVYYQSMVQAMDTELGRLFASVDFATTTVIFIGDNGSPNPGSVVASPYDQAKSKGTIYNTGSHTPLVIAGQGVTGRGYVGALVNCVDLFPTILELAGRNPATISALSGVDIDGISLLPYFTNPSRRSLRDYIYSEEFQNTWNDSTRERTIRNFRYALIERGTGTLREFYDMYDDPLQATNLLNRTLTRAEQTNLDALNDQMDALLATR
jgi:arylsulfatase B